MAFCYEFWEYVAPVDNIFVVRGREDANESCILNHGPPEQRAQIKFERNWFKIDRSIGSRFDITFVTCRYEGVNRVCNTGASGSVISDHICRPIEVRARDLNRPGRLNLKWNSFFSLYICSLSMMARSYSIRTFRCTNNNVYIKYFIGHPATRKRQPFPISRPALIIPITDKSLFARL